MSDILRPILLFILGALIVIGAMTYKSRLASARDLDGRYAAQNPELHEWFEGLRSGKGPCCSDADGSAVDDPNWKKQHKVIGQTSGEGGPQNIYSDYAVFLDGEWRDVSPDAVVTEKNRIGRAMVWPIKGYLGVTIRCFMPGTMS